VRYRPLRRIGRWGDSAVVPEDEIRDNRPVPSCCVQQSDYRRFFRTNVARRDARRYRRRGIDRATRRLVDAVKARGLDGARVLEGGGGIGAIQIELLEAGAAGAVNVELSSAYEQEAESLLRERGLEGRVERRLGDFVAAADSLPCADVVVLHRAVCCYPDGPAFVAAAAAHSTRLLALTVPRDNVLTRLGARAINLFLRVRGCGFRTFVHRMPDLLDAARAEGLQPVTVERATLVWQLAVLERAGYDTVSAERTDRLLRGERIHR
jgi:magnesium-protoporphyrin O-methyltransferase